MKRDIIEHAKFYSRMIASEKNKLKRKELEKQLNSDEKKLVCINLDTHTAVKIIEKVNHKIDKLKSELQVLDNERIRGTIIRPKAQYYETGERNSKYFFGLEKRNAKSKAMTCVIIENKQRINNPKQVLQEQRKFFKDLYTTNQDINFHMSVEMKKDMDMN